MNFFLLTADLIAYMFISNIIPIKVSKMINTMY